MTPAPRLVGYVCRMCGNESIQTPWDEPEFVCSQELGGCGATNKGPLQPKIGNVPAIVYLPEPEEADLISFFEAGASDE